MKLPWTIYEIDRKRVRRKLSENKTGNQTDTHFGSKDRIDEV